MTNAINVIDCPHHSNHLQLSSSSSTLTTTMASTLLTRLEDGMACVWDLCMANTLIQASLGIWAPLAAPVALVSFVSSFPAQLAPALVPLPLPSSLLSAFLACEYSIYLAAGNGLYGYDLQYCTTLIVIEPTFDLSFLGSDDEVNQIYIVPPAAEKTTTIMSLGGGTHPTPSSSSYLLDWIRARH